MKAGRKNILLKWGCNYENEQLFHGTGPFLLLGRNEKIEAALDWVYNPERGVGGKIKLVYTEK